MICKKLKKFKPRVRQDNKVITARAKIEGIPQFFFVVGHNKRKSGAVNYKGQSEYDWGNIIGLKLQKAMEDCKIPFHIVTRPEYGGYGHECRSVANKIKSITGGELSYGYNCHFNATDGAKGSEGLVAKGTKENFDNILADIFTDKLSELGIKERHDDGVFEVDSKHNGAGMLKAMRRVDCFSIIGEPCFNYKYAESIAVFEFVDRFVNILKESIIESYTQKGIVLN